MTKWVLVCEKCGFKRIIDIGYNLREFKRVYLYCPSCGSNTFYEVLGTEDDEDKDSANS